MKKEKQGSLEQESSRDMVNLVDRSGHIYRKPYLSAILIVIYIFFSQNRIFHISNGVNILFYLLSCCAPLLYSINNIGKVKGRLVFIFILFDIILSLGSLYSPDTQSALLSTFYRIGALTIYIYFIMNDRLCFHALRYVIICSGIHLFFIYIHWLFPSIMNVISNVYFDSTFLNAWNRVSNAGYCIGLNRQVGFATLFIGPVLALYFAKVCNTNEKILKNLLLLSLAVIGIILTAKRSSFGATFFANAIYLAIIAFDKKSKKMKTLLLSTAILCTTLFILMSTNIGQLLMMKFEVYDITNGSGRERLWSVAIEYWKQSPLFGIGTNAYAAANEMSTHNTYLQLLCENGIVGLVVFASLVVSVFMHGIKSLFWLPSDDSRRIYVSTSLYFQAFYLSFAFFESAYANNTMFILYVIIAAYPVSIIKKDRSNINAKQV